MITLEITGFKTEEQKEKFIGWYCNQGEQDFETYLEINGDHDTPCISGHLTPNGAIYLEER
jgi:hypothetical protein